MLLGLGCRSTAPVLMTGVLAAVLSGSVWTSARQGVPPQATFLASVDVVAVYATVVGEHGQLARSLSARDFELKVDGKRQAITVFESGLLPITIVILLDDSPSMRESKPDIMEAGRAFRTRLRPGDRATVGLFSRTVWISGNLTDDRDELSARLAEERPVMSGTALWDALNAGMATLEDEPGRRVVLAISDGDDNTSEVSAADMAQRAVRDGVMVYGIGVRSGQGRLSKSLKDMAKDSGGYFFELSGNASLTSVFQRVADELHTQYLIGFTPPIRDGKPHKLEVKVKRSGHTVRARKSFIASEQGR